VSIDPSVQFPGMDAAAIEASAVRMLEALAELPPARAAAAAAAAATGDAPPALEPPPKGTANRGAEGNSLRRAAAEEEHPAQLDNPVMWGGCSVGPVLRSRLLAAGLPSPTAIQAAAFAPLSKGQNALLAAQTGSGKTLAYVLPLLATRLKRGVPCQALVVCPSRDVAMQLRAEVD
jgi:ATP-dependent helicase YprA (DUF1998 family)